MLRKLDIKQNNLNGRAFHIPQNTPITPETAYSKEAMDFVNNANPKLKNKYGKKQQIVEELQEA